MKVISFSENSLVKELFEASMDDESSSKVSLGLKFRLSLNDLMTSINSTNPHFIRCIKPNSNKAPKKFDSSLVLNQLRTSGTLDTIKVRQIGYPHWVLHEDFFERYWLLLKSEQQEDFVDNCETILEEESKLHDGDEGMFRFEIGHSKVLYNETVNTILETKRYTARNKAALAIQTQERARKAREIFQKKKNANANLLEALQARDVKLIRQRIEEAKEAGLLDRIVISAQQELAKIIEEQRVDAAIAIQKTQRARVARMKFAKLKVAQENLLTALDEEDLDLIEQRLEEARDAGLLDRIVNDGESSKQGIIDKRNTAATQIQSIFRQNRAKKDVQVLQKAKNELDKAVEEQDIRKIRESLQGAETAHLLQRFIDDAANELNNIEYQAIVSVQSLQRQRVASKHFLALRNAQNNLFAAQKAQDVEGIEKSLEAAREAGLPERLLEEASALREKLIQQKEEEERQRREKELELQRQKQLEEQRERERLEQEEQLRQRELEAAAALITESADSIDDAFSVPLSFVQVDTSGASGTPTTSTTSTDPLPPLEPLPHFHLPDLETAPNEADPPPPVAPGTPVIDISPAIPSSSSAVDVDVDTSDSPQLVFVKQEDVSSQLPDFQTVQLPFSTEPAGAASSDLFFGFGQHGYGTPVMAQPRSADEARFALQNGLSSQSPSVADRIAILTNALLSASQFEIPDEETAPASALCKNLSQILGGINEHLPKAAKSEDSLNALRGVVLEAEKIPGLLNTSEIMRTKQSIRRYDVVLQHLRNAIASRNQALLTPAYQNALALGINRPEVNQAQQLIEQLIDEQFNMPQFDSEPMSPPMRPNKAYGFQHIPDHSLSPSLHAQQSPYQPTPYGYPQNAYGGQPQGGYYSTQAVSPPAQGFGGYPGGPGGPGGAGGPQYQGGPGGPQPEVVSEPAKPMVSPARLEAAHQILEAEKKYIGQLKVLEKVFRLRLATTTNTSVEILTQDQIDIVFLNVGDVLQVTQNLYGKLQDLNDKGPDVLLTEVGQIFIGFTSHFEVYRKYNTQFSEASKTSKELRANNAKFGEFVKMNEMCESIELDDLMNAPHTHLSTYISLLKNLVEKTDSSEKVNQLEIFTYQMAIDRIESLISSTADAIREQREKDRALSEEKEDEEIAAAQAALKAKVEARKKVRALSQDKSGGATPTPAEKEVPKIPDGYIMSDDDEDQRPPTDTDDDKEEEEKIYNPQLPALKKLEDLITPPSTPPKSKKLPPEVKQSSSTPTKDGEQHTKPKKKTKKKPDQTRVQQRKREEIERAKKMLAAQKQLPVLKGYVEKKSPALLGPWQRRYLTVAEYNVFYGKNKLEQQVTSAQYALNNDMNCIPLMVVNSIKVKKTKDSRQFVVQARDIKNAELREYLFKAKSTRDRDIWVAGLNKHKDHLAALLDCPAIRLNSVA